jgi:enoyl-[acyl-carrier-protein] reductase (NADH)
MGEIKVLSDKLGCEVIAADATSLEDMTNLFTQSQEILGGKLDFVLHSIGMSVNVRKNKHYTDLNYEWMKTTMDISAISFHKMMQTLYKLDAMNDWGSILALTYMASQRTFPDYSKKRCVSTRFRSHRLGRRQVLASKVSKNFTIMPIKCRHLAMRLRRLAPIIASRISAILQNMSRCKISITTVDFQIWA